jgi:ketosteroid isomerase-like protein
MKSLHSLLLPVFLFACALTGCDKPERGPDDKALFQVIQDNLQAMEKKDLDGVMATIHPKGPYYGSTRDAVAEVFKVLDLKYTLSDLKVVSATPDEAQVSFVQKTEKTGGDGEFQDNIQQGVHTLRPDNGKWKIYRTTLTKITDLNGKPLGAPQPAAPEPAPAAAPAAPAPEAAPAPAPATTPAPPATPSPAPGGEPVPKPAEKPPQ